MVFEKHVARRVRGATCVIFHTSAPGKSPNFHIQRKPCDPRHAIIWVQPLDLRSS